MTLLSFDQSSHITGYAVFIDNKLQDYGKFTFEDADIGNRLLKIRNKVSNLLTQYKPDEVIFEDIQQQTNVINNIQTFKVLAQVYGIFSELLTELQIPYSSILATSWKSILNIKGHSRQEQKKSAQDYVFNTYGIKTAQDIADAICIGASYINKNKNAW